MSVADIFESACKLKLAPFIQAGKTDAIHDSEIVAGSSIVADSSASDKVQLAPECAWQQYWDEYICIDTTMTHSPEKDAPKATDVVCKALDAVISSFIVTWFGCC